MKGDFHIHTQFSDGTLAVEEVLQKASETLDIISITDHDTLSGARLASTLAGKYKIKVIYGLELSTELNNESVHLLGYFKDLDEISPLEAALEQQRQHRIKRCYQILERLEKYFHIQLDMTPLLKLHSITRGSIANEIVAQGYQYTKTQIFAQMIGDGCIAYLPSTKISTQEGIALLRQAKATIILAHPVLLKKNNYQDIVRLGIDGIEAIYPLNTLNATKRFKKFALSHDLVYTAGSDFHSFNDYKHGNIGCCPLEEEALTAFIKKVME